MRLISIILFLLCFPSIICADQTAITQDGKSVLLKDDGTWSSQESQGKSTSEAHFRNTRWGMTRAQVKASEKTNPVVENDSYIGYKDNVVGQDAIAIYFFTNDIFVKSRYMFTDPHTNKNDYLIDFDTVKDALIKKYGKPINDKQIWRNDLYKDNYSQRGMAVSVGHYSQYCDWETPETDITLILFGENFKVKLIAEYISKEHKNFAAAQKTSQQGEKL